MTNPAKARCRQQLRGGTGAVLCFLALMACHSPPAYLRERQAVDLTTSLQREFAKSVEAEKNAVIATTDEESQAFATESQRASSDVEHLRAQLREVLTAMGQRAALDKLTVFDAAWAQVAAVDSRILPLAVANTNLKAARLSQQEGAAALDRFVEPLEKMAASATDVKWVREVGTAAVAALRIQTLHAPHIAAVDDASMLVLEQRIDVLEKEVSSALVDLRKHAPKGEQVLLDSAEGAWNDYRRITAEVVGLSRRNTNVISFELSTHEKRAVTLPCEAALTALSAEVAAGRNAATR